MTPTLSAICPCPRGIQAAHHTDSHGHCPQNRLTCPNQQAEPCTPTTSSQGERAPGQSRRTIHRQQLSPHTPDTGVKECHPGCQRPSHHDDHGTRGAAASCTGPPPKSSKTPGTAPARSAGSRYPHTASRRRTALPAKPARQRPARRTGDPDRPAMHPGGTRHPPPVDPRRHRASPSDHADASDSDELRALGGCIFIRRPT